MNLLTAAQEGIKFGEKATKGPWLKEEKHFMYPDGPLLKSQQGMHICVGIGLASKDDVDLIQHCGAHHADICRALVELAEALTFYAGRFPDDDLGNWQERVCEDEGDIARNALATLTKEEGT